MKQIYTGYQWREMTGPELEIMEASRIVDEKTDDAQAGDIYEAPDKCLYCIGDSNHNGVLAGPDRGEIGTIVYLDESQLTIETYDPHGMPDDMSFPINYCPVCGRKLEEAE